MKNNPEKRYRRSIRLKNFDYSQPGYYFLTVCTHNGENIFGEISGNGMVLNEFGEIIRSYWNQLPKRYLGTESVAFVVMPNHVHGIVRICGPAIVEADIVGAVHELPLQRRKRRNMLIPKLVGWFKMNTAKRINQMRNTAGSPVWQRNYWEHVIRNQESLNRIVEYVNSNPFRWHLDRNNPNRQGEDEFDKWLAEL